PLEELRILGDRFRGPASVRGKAFIEQVHGRSCTTRSVRTSTRTPPASARVWSRAIRWTPGAGTPGARPRHGSPGRALGGEERARLDAKRGAGAVVSAMQASYGDGQTGVRRVRSGLRPDDHRAGDAEGGCVRPRGPYGANAGT